MHVHVHNQCQLNQPWKCLKLLSCVITWKKYYTDGTILKSVFYISERDTLDIPNTQIHNHSHTDGTILKSVIYISERGTIDIPNTQIHNHAHIIFTWLIISPLRFTLDEY
jgi:hypothetical protein